MVIRRIKSVLKRFSIWYMYEHVLWWFGCLNGFHQTTEHWGVSIEAKHPYAVKQVESGFLNA